MTARPDPQQFGEAAAFPAASSAKRLWPLAKALTTRTVFVVGILAIWQQAAPDAYKPAAMLGHFTAAVVTAETNGAADAQVALQRRMAELGNEMQLRLMKAQTMIQQQVNSLGGQTAMTEISDATCIGGQLVGMIAQAFNSYDIADGAAKVAQGGCAVAKAARIQLTRAQQAAMQSDLTLAAAGFDQHQYSLDDGKALVGYFQTLPPGVQAIMRNGLDLTDPAAQIVFGDRLTIYYRQHQA